jgi:hypothetical protein
MTLHRIAACSVNSFRLYGPAKEQRIMRAGA